MTSRHLSPRPYHSPDDQEGPSLLTLVLMMNLAVYFFQAFLAFPPPPGSSPAGYISQEVLREGAWWSVFTHLFVHANWIHLTVNLLLIWLAGRSILTELGPWHFTYIYLLGGWMGAALQLFAGPSGQSVRLIGSSGSALALIAAFAALHPYYSVTEKIRRFFPIRLKARNLLFGLILAELALDIYQRFQPLADNSPAHLVHVGGAILGWFYVARLGARQERALSAQWSKSPRFKVESFYDDPLPYAHAGKTTRPKRLLNDLEQVADPVVAEPEPVSDQEFIQQVVNPVLEKLHAQGMESLTEAERKILLDAAARLGE